MRYSLCLLDNLITNLDSLWCFLNAGNLIQMRQVSREFQGHFAMLIFSALVAGSFSLGALVANEISPLAITAARFAIASIVIGISALLLGSVTSQSFSAPWRFLILGGLFSLYFVLMFEGLKTANPISASAVFTLTPVLSGVFGYILLRQVTTSRMVFALTIGAVGALWVIFKADLTALLQFQIGRGEIIYFGGCAAHALYTPMILKLNRGESAIVFTLGTLLAGCLILLIVGWNDIRATDWMSLPAVVWGTLLYISIFASAATFLLLQISSLRLPAAKVMAYTYLTPSWVILWEFALGNSVPQTFVVVGVTITIVALGLLLKNSDKHVEPL